MWHSPNTVQSHAEHLYIRANFVLVVNIVLGILIGIPIGFVARLIWTPPSNMAMFFCILLMAGIGYFIGSFTAHKCKWDADQGRSDPTECFEQTNSDKGVPSLISAYFD